MRVNFELACFFCYASVTSCISLSWPLLFDVNSIPAWASAKGENCHRLMSSVSGNVCLQSGWTVALSVDLSWSTQHWSTMQNKTNRELINVNQIFILFLGGGGGEGIGWSGLCGLTDYGLTEHKSYHVQLSQTPLEEYSTTLTAYATGIGNSAM